MPGQLLLTDISWPSICFISDYIHTQGWNVVTCRYLNFSVVLAKPPLTLGYGWLNTFHTNFWVLLLTHALIWEYIGVGFPNFLSNFAVTSGLRVNVFSTDITAGRLIYICGYHINQVLPAKDSYFHLVIHLCRGNHTSSQFHTSIVVGSLWMAINVFWMVNWNEIL